MKALFEQFLQEEQGQDLVEYALLMAFIALAAVTALSTIGTNLSALWNKVNSAISTANSAAAAGK
jgi:pilus assembly protein Flp/PilA